MKIQFKLFIIEPKIKMGRVVGEKRMFKFGVIKRSRGLNIYLGFSAIRIEV